ncbi:tetratricopeptide repeat protein [Ornithinibacillus scapharcae]|uniref:tetratricopeptide repeat protein n=1 Tax=Ornithinibacillus scapharcae TaxID=1147159 RepID=UPI000225AA6A|nr:tetratricopeptide repeat protein [Ornithinibacillus scapharcae]
MELQDLAMELATKGYYKSKEIVKGLQNSKQLLKDLLLVMDECVRSDELPDDIYILYRQLNGVTSFHKDYRYIIIRDIARILTESLNPSDDLAVIYIDDDELAQVVTLYTEAVTGNLEAQIELAHFYKTIEHDDWAFEWFLVAAQAGNSDALYWLGNYYFVGTVVDQDLEKTYNCYKQAAEKGHADAMNNYADMYLRGEYVPKDEEKALELFMKAAELGVPEAMYTLGYMYQNGVGTEKDLEVSREWFVKSAKSGDVFAANRLGHEAVEDGNGEEALSWYRMAAERGDSYGEFNLGLCYENGIGTPVNIKKAKSWYQKAALKGDKEAKERLKGL